MSLSGPLGELQAIRREATNFEITDPKIQQVHNHMITAMDAAIDGFLAFMSQDPDYTVNRFFDTYDEALANWSLGLAELEAGDE